ncbi:unnamed protein product [Closterium sp. Naga37s-1]|nr:unnamed protein product [Closterium sp. Naga37s-1]
MRSPAVARSAVASESRAVRVLTRAVSAALAIWFGGREHAVVGRGQAGGEGAEEGSEGADEGWLLQDSVARLGQSVTGQSAASAVPDKRCFLLREAVEGPYTPATAVDGGSDFKRCCSSLFFPSDLQEEQEIIAAAANLREAVDALNTPAPNGSATNPSSLRSFDDAVQFDSKSPEAVPVPAKYRNSN